MAEHASNMRCAVVTPVGPGHEYLVEDCVESVQHAFAASRGPFTDLRMIRIDDAQGMLGRSAARNRGVAEACEAEADWIFFLDADDLMHPGAFGVMTDYHATHDAVWGLICELGSDEESYFARPGQLASIERLDRLLLTDPTLTLQMGHFVRTAAALETPFNVTLDCGEDFDYYLRLWSSFRCRKVPQALFINRRGFHSTGPRSATGVQWREAVQRIIAARCGSESVICRFSCDGQSFEFRITNPFDPVQRHYFRGEFSGLPELRFLTGRLERGLAMVEIGAGNGNHAVFLSRFLEPSRFVALEEDPALLENLKCNLLLNGAVNVEVRPMASTGFEHLDRIVGETVDFMRIDLARTGPDILRGAARTIERCRPAMLATVLEPQLQALLQWCGQQEYRIAARFDRSGSVSLVLQAQRTPGTGP